MSSKNVVPEVTISICPGAASLAQKAAWRRWWSAIIAEAKAELPDVRLADTLPDGSGGGHRRCKVAPDDGPDSEG